MNMNTFHFNLSLLKKVLIVIALTLTFFTLTSISWAVTVQTPIEVEKFVDITKSPLLPARDTSSVSGVLPQYWGLKESDPFRKVTLDDERLKLKTQSWQATISNGSVVYCGAYHDPIRYGKWDDTIQYLYPGETKINYNTKRSFSAIGKSIKTLMEQLRSYYDKGLNDSNLGVNLNMGDARKLGGYERYAKSIDTRNGDSVDDLKTEIANYKVKVSLEGFDDEEALGYLVTSGETGTIKLPEYERK